MAISSEFRILVGDTVSKTNGVYSGIEFGNSQGKIMLTNVTGMEIPPIRNNNGNWSGRDGGYMSSQLYSGREITITGFYWDSEASCSAYKSGEYGYSVREKLANAFAIRKLYPIFISFVNGKVYYTEGYLTDFQMDYDNYKTGNYQVTFYCPEYALSIADTYGDPSSIWRSSILVKEMLGGHLVPEELPVLFESGSHASIINYRGLIPGHPQITIKGPITNPVIYNQATKQQFIMGTEDDPFVLSASQTMLIDMDNRQVTVGGKSRSMYINEASEWIELTPGKNKIYFSSSSESDINTANIVWKELLQGV